MAKLKKLSQKYKKIFEGIISVIFDSERNKVQNKYIIIISLVVAFSPYTLMSIGYFGLSEIMIIVLFLYYISKNGINFKFYSNGIFTRFWIIFITISGFGFLLRTLLGTNDIQLELFLFDLFAYLFILFTTFLLESIFNERKFYIDKDRLIKNVYLFTSFLLMVFFILSKFTDSFMGFSLKSGQFFSPLASNLHHIGMVVAVLPFIGIKLLCDSKSPNKKFLYLIFITMNIVMGLSNGAAKVRLGWVMSIGLFLCILIFKYARRIEKKSLILIFLIILVCATSILALYFNQIYHFLIKVFTSLDTRGERAYLYAKAIERIPSVILIGYGPGNRILLFDNTYRDAHQTLLTITLQAGLVGTFVFLRLMFKVFKTCLKDVSLFLAIIPLTVYALGGDVLRRLPVWIFLIIFYYYCKNKEYPIKNQ